jgi:hypothetical protein
MYQPVIGGILERMGNAINYNFLTINAMQRGEMDALEDFKGKASALAAVAASVVEALSIV